MPVYANISGFAVHRRHPNALLLIIGGHAALIAAVMTAKMVVPPRIPDPPIIVRPIPIPPDPPPVPDPPAAKDTHQPSRSTPYQPPRNVPLPTFDDPVIGTTPIPQSDLGPVVGTDPDPGPATTPIAQPVRVGPRFVTPERLIKPPYPADKVRLEEEAVLRLKLSIDDHGRVVGVEPVGKVDRSFFEAARRHLLANWRYKPATEDGRPVASTTVISLTFRLE
jgi:protein TonB